MFCSTSRCLALSSEILAQMTQMKGLWTRIALHVTDRGPHSVCMRNSLRYAYGIMADWGRSRWPADDEGATDRRLYDRVLE